MNINYENKLFNGQIVDGLDSTPTILSPDFYQNPDLTASKLNELRLQILETQMHLYNMLEKLEMDILEWNREEREINNNLTNCETIINDRLFLRSDTDGFYKSIYYDFHGQESEPLLPLENVEVDTVNHCVRLKHSDTKIYTNQEVLESSRRIGQEFYTIQMSRTPGTGTERAAIVPGSSVAALGIDNNTSGWIGVVTSLTPHSVGLTFDIIMNSPMEVGELYLGVIDSSVTTKISAVVTDENGTSHIIIENADAINSNVIYINKKVKAIQLILTKNSYDEITENDSGYRYIFNLKKIILNKMLNGFERSGVYSSKIYLLSNVNQLALEVCDFVESNVNSIDYKFVIIKDEGANYYPVTPINKMPGSAPYGLKLFNTQIVNNFENPKTLIDSGDSTSLVDIKDVSEIYSFNNQYKVINYLLETSQNGLQSANVFLNYSKERSNANDLVEKIGKDYYTWIYIDQNENRKIDLGSSGITIEGFVPTSELSDVFDFNITNNVTNLNKTGWFKIKIPGNSYYSVGDEFSTIEELKELDPLFPYNGKYLIEGTNLNIDPYTGFKKRAQKKLTNTNNILEISQNQYYLLRYNNVTVDNVTRNGFCAVVNKDINARNCYIEHYKKGSDAVAVALVASLRTSDPSKTPILSSFKIKIGE